MLEGFSEWLSSTPVNAFLADTTKLSTWLIVPMSQTIHIVGVAVVMIAVGMLNLRLLGVECFVTAQLQCPNTQLEISARRKMGINEKGNANGFSRRNQTTFRSPFDQIKNRRQ